MWVWRSVVLLDGVFGELLGEFEEDVFVCLEGVLVGVEGFSLCLMCWGLDFGFFLM